MPRVARPLRERFEEKVDRSGGPDACHLWTASLGTTGYGQLMLGRVPRKAHRVAWELAHGAVPTGLCVLHRCDNPPCVNPSHLFVGTHADNVADKVAKGRQADGSQSPVGEAHPGAKLTSLAVIEIRRRHAAGATMAAIGRAYGVTIQQVKRIVTRVSWRWLEESMLIRFSPMTTAGGR